MMAPPVYSLRVCIRLTGCSPVAVPAAARRLSGGSYAVSCSTSGRSSWATPGLIAQNWKLDWPPIPIPKDVYCSWRMVMLRSLRRHEAELIQQPQKWVGGPVGVDALLRHPVVLGGRGTQGGDSEIAAPGVVTANRLVEARRSPVLQHCPHLRLHGLIVGLVEVGPHRTRPPQRAVRFEQMPQGVHFAEHNRHRLIDPLLSCPSQEESRDPVEGGGRLLIRAHR